MEFFFPALGVMGEGHEGLYAALWKEHLEKQGHEEKHGLEENQGQELKQEQQEKELEKKEQT
jgi:hypothetical protein